jgi:Na+-transporting methylmalonyl-CoA/oxaloacetate decarboxylase gamma subunit
MTMNIMRKNIRIFRSHAQHGAALVIAILILLVLTVIGIYAVSTSTFETKISGFEREFKEAFYTADSGEPIGIALTKTIIHYVPSAVGDLPAPWNNASLIDDADLFVAGGALEIYTDVRNADTPDTNPPDINSKGAGNNLGLPNDVQLRVDIDRLSSYQMPGGATEYGSGYEGIGQGGGGEVAIIYAIDSVGRYTYTNAASGIEAGYRHVVGMPGGE